MVLELRDLKLKIQGLLYKGFIRPSASPRGASIFFLKKMKGSRRTGNFILRHKGVD